MEVYIWLGLMILCLIIEAVTVGLLTIWFAAGALAAMAGYALGLGIFGQIVIFFVVSFVLLYFTRPLAMKHINAHKTPTNYEEILNRLVNVTETVDNYRGVGKAMYNGQEWSARGETNEMILRKGCLAKVVAIEGVKLILVPVEVYRSN